MGVQGRGAKTARRGRGPRAPDKLTVELIGPVARGFGSAEAAGGARRAGYREQFELRIGAWTALVVKVVDYVDGSVSYGLQPPAAETSARSRAGNDQAARAAQTMPRRTIVRISGTSNSLAWWPSEE